MVGVQPDKHQGYDGRSQQDQPFKQGRLGGGHRDSKVGFKAGHAGHGEIPVGNDALLRMQMMQVIFAGVNFCLSKPRARGDARHVLEERDERAVTGKSQFEGAVTEVAPGGE